MSDDREQQIRDRAYAIWDEEGRPEGREAEHWSRAVREVGEGQGGQPTSAEPGAPPAKAPKRQTRPKATEGAAGKAGAVPKAKQGTAAKPGTAAKAKGEQKRAPAKPSRKG